MVIHMNGSAEELLYFVKGLQFPVTAGFVEETEIEIEKEAEKEVTQREAPVCSQMRQMELELHWMDMADLKSRAIKKGITPCELASQIVEKYLHKINEE